MNIQNKKREEKVRNIDYSNLTTDRIIHYSNLLNEKSEFFKDNEITDFSQFNSAKNLKTINTFNTEIFL